MAAQMTSFIGDMASCKWPLPPSLLLPIVHRFRKFFRVSVATRVRFDIP